MMVLSVFFLLRNSNLFSDLNALFIKNGRKRLFQECTVVGDATVEQRALFSELCVASVVCEWMGSLREEGSTGLLRNLSTLTAPNS